MNLFSVDIYTANLYLEKSNLTIGKAFTTIDHWCDNNDAWYKLEDMWLDTNGVGTRAKINVKCFYKNNKLAKIFEIKYA